MKKLKRRIISVFAAAAMLMSCTLTANSEVLKQNSVSTITTTEDLKSSSTVYVGEVVVGGLSKIKYVYSSDLSHNSTVWDDLRDTLSGMEDTDFAGLFPAEFDSESEEKGLKLCNVKDYVADMDESWVSASAVGEKYYSPTYEVSAESSENLYDVDEGFKAKLDAKKAERVEAYDEPIDNNKTIITHLDSRTVTNVYYRIEDGQLVRHSDINVIYDCEEINVIYTRAEMKVKSNTIVNVTGKQAKIVQDSTLYVGEIVIDGESTVKYVWSDDITRAETIFAAVKKALSGMEGEDYAALMPDLIGEENEKGAAECSDASAKSKMDSSWKSAEGAAAVLYPELNVSASSSADLYDTDENFAKACFFENDCELVDAAGQPYEQHSPLGKLTATNTDSVTYTVENGVLVKYIDRFIDYTCEAVKVVYTKVELSTSPVDTRKKGDLNNNGKIDASDLLQVKSHIKKVKPLEGDDFKIADVDDNGAINAADLLKMKAHMKGVSYLW